MKAIENKPLTDAQIQKLVKKLTQPEIEEMISTVRDLMIAQGEKITERNAKVAIIAERYAPDIDKLGAEIESKELLIRKWSETNRVKVFGTEKTKKFTFGSVQFRSSSVKLAMLGIEWTENLIIEKLKKLKRTAFIRTEESLNRTAILEAYKAKKITDEALAEFGMKADQPETCTLKINLPSTQS